MQFMALSSKRSANITTYHLLQALCLDSKILLCFYFSFKEIIFLQELEILWTLILNWEPTSLIISPYRMKIICAGN
ncbi:hypothetical protein HZS_2613 [Henneguya salminicola]|nr:hypothetical protein HZS_2613 [Henneguya salminicola]